MGSIVVQAFTTLDGVVQAGGGPVEDPEGGFEHGGWMRSYEDDDGGDLILEWEANAEALLLGRKTYDIWNQSWGVWPEDAPGLMGELTRRYNRIPKYVASRSQTEFTWKNTHLLGPDVPAVAAKVRDETDGEVRIWGSTELVRTLAEHDLIDEYRLVVYPLVLGTGKKLFPDGFPLTKLTLTSTRTLSSGIVLVNTYERVRD